MNRFFISLLLSLIFIDISKCSEFCDVKAMDNVFNVGHFVHMTRCGEVWTYDPRMNERAGGFIRDYSWYVFARYKLYKNMIAQKGKFDDKDFRFAAFSFHELDCVDINENMVKDCHTAIKYWNHFGVIVDDLTAFSFKYEYEFRGTDKSNNGFGFPEEQKMDQPNRHIAWPNASKVTQEEYKPWKESDSVIHSALFSPVKTQSEQIDKHPILYIVLQNKDGKRFCLTYLDMKDMLYDYSNVKTWLYNWNQAECFLGHVIGMFYDEKEQKPYLVGRYDKKPTVFEDQVYQIDTVIGVRPELKPQYNPGDPGKRQTRKVRDSGQPLSLRQYFGCDTQTVQMNSTSSRKKRSIADTKQISRFSWKSLQKEIRDDFIELSVMSTIALFLVYLIYRLSNN